MLPKEFIGRNLGGSSPEDRMFYTPEQVLGEGTFGVALLATYSLDKSLVVVKVLKPTNDADQIAAMRREARTLSYLRHPNIIPFYWYDVERTTRREGDREVVEEYPYIVMPYANGGSLKDLLKAKGMLPPDQSVQYVRQTAAGVGEAHKHNMLHRDLKPPNLLLHQQEGQEEETLYVSDFGIARVAPTETSIQLGKKGDVAGTPAYMAPEQFLGLPVQASDQYSLGVIAYELLTGQRPFHADSYTGYYELHSEQMPKELKEILKDKMGLIHQELQEPVMKSMAKHPHERYPSVQAFGYELHEGLVRGQELERRNLSTFDQYAPTIQTFTFRLPKFRPN